MFGDMSYEDSLFTPPTSDLYEYQSNVLSQALRDETAFLNLKRAGVIEACFSDALHRKMWNILTETYQTHGVSYTIMKGLLLDSGSVPELVTEEMLRLYRRTVTPQDLRFSVLKIVEKEARTRLTELANFVSVENAGGMNVTEIVSNILSRVNALNMGNDNIKEYNAVEATDETANEIREREKEDSLDGVKTGIPSLDAEIKYMYYAAYTMVLARPGHCKTTLMMNMFMNNIRGTDKPVFITLEMPVSHLIIKMLGAWTHIDVNKIFSPNLMTEEEKQRVAMALHEISQKEFYIVHAVSLTISEFNMLATKYARLGCNMLYLDYIQLVKKENGETPEDASEYRVIFKAVREIINRINATEKIAFCLGAQASRKVELRPIEERGPLMSDIEWSSSFEQDAGLVIGILNREKYEGEECEHKNTLFINFPKARYQNAKSIELSFIGRIQKISDLDHNLAEQRSIETVAENIRANV